MFAMMVSACGSSSSGSEPATTGTETPTAEPAKTAELFLHSFIQGYDAQMDKMLELYQNEHPNITISLQTNETDYDKVLQTKIAIGDIPDLFLSGPFAKNQIYAASSEDLTDEAYWNEISQDAYPAVTSTDGKKVGVPFQSDPWAFRVNKDVFEKAGITKYPETLTELKEACEKIKAIGVIPFGAAFKNSSVIGHLHTFPYSLDGAIYPDQLKTLLDHSKKLTDYTFIKKIYDMMDLISANTQEKPFDYEVDPAAVLLGEGKVAMIIEAPYASIMKANPDVKIGCMPVPLSDDPKDAKIYSSVGWVLHVGKDGKNVAEAKEFVSWLVQSDTAKKWLSEDMQVLSPVKGVTPAGNQFYQEAAALIEKDPDIVRDFGYNIFPAGFANLMKPIAQKYLVGELTREQAIAAEQKLFDEYVGE